MMKQFELPQIQITEFEAVDVITTSGTPGQEVTPPGGVDEGMGWN